ncbi:uncharacterized protein LOC115767023 [Drosophila novamexicana]|uniref:uncharacterized protein LOC115767023 n=1 Tax=Drosophila novamexicana TaxID=47314 RepID=UPI0011E5F5B4|nr:uncharacterized protein LOC115767023 [Drosophila novamexicana]
MGNNKGKRKALTQRQVSSRMNFLYQASNLMAHSNNNTLAAYYGKLCRNVGTKALMHMSPALKRTLCKRCSLPLLPGVNTSLKLDQKHEQQQVITAAAATATATSTTSKRRHRRLRSKRSKGHNQTAAAVQKDAAPSASMDEHARLHLECALCGSKRRFQVDTQNECWPERSEAIVQVIRLDGQRNADEAEGGGEAAGGEGGGTAREQ